MPQNAPSHPTLLVVDDSPTVLQVVACILASASYHVVSLRRAARVVEVALSKDPDLIIVDFSMPQLSGSDVCRRLAEHPKLCNVPVLLMSTRGDTAGERAAGRLGVAGHVIKPFAPQTLIDAVDGILGPRAPARAIPQRGPAQGQRGINTPTGVRPGNGGAAASGASFGGALLVRGGQSRRSPDGSSADPTTPHAQRLVEMLAQRLNPNPQAAQQATEDLRNGLDALLNEPRLKEHLWRILIAQPDAPGLFGNLATIPVAEILQLLALQRQTGQLQVHHGRCVVTLTVAQGEVRGATTNVLAPELKLGTILVRNGHMTPHELEVLLSNRRGTFRRIGQQVVELGYIDREQLQAALRHQSAEIIYEMLRWASGHFTFQREPTPRNASGIDFDLGLSVDELLLEGFRRLDEWGLIEQALPNLDLVLRRCVAAGDLPNEASPSDPQRMKILAAIDGRRTAREVMELLGGTPFAVATALYRLISAGVVSVELPTPHHPQHEIEEVAWL